MTKGKKAAAICLAVVAVLAMLVGGFVGRLFHTARGEHTGEGTAQGPGGILAAWGTWDRLSATRARAFRAKTASLFCAWAWTITGPTKIWSIQSVRAPIRCSC